MLSCFYLGLSIQSPRIFLSTSHQTRSFERGTCWYNRWLWLKTLDIRSKSENWETDCIKSEEPSCQDVRGRWRGRERERESERESERERGVAKMSCNANRLNSFQTSIIIPTKMIESSKVLLKHLRLSSLPSSFLSTFSERNHPNHPIEKKKNPRSQNWKLNSSNWTACVWLCAVLCTQRASSWRFGLQILGPLGMDFRMGFGWQNFDLLYHVGKFWGIHMLLFYNWYPWANSEKLRIQFWLVLTDFASQNPFESWWVMIVEWLFGRVLRWKSSFSYQKYFMYNIYIYVLYPEAMNPAVRCSRLHPQV